MAQVIRDPRDGRWLARWRDPSGHQRKRSFTRKVDAQRRLDQALSDLHQGRYIEPAAAKAMTGDYAIQWASGLAHLKVSAATRYRGIVRIHIVPRWGTWQLGKITLSDVNLWIADLAVGLRPGTVRQTHRVLSLILDTAVADGLIARNPAAGAKLRRQVRRTGIPYGSTGRGVGPRLRARRSAGVDPRLHWASLRGARRPQGQALRPREEATDGVGVGDRGSGAADMVDTQDAPDTIGACSTHASDADRGASARSESG